MTVAVETDTLRARLIRAYTDLRDLGSGIERQLPHATPDELVRMARALDRQLDAIRILDSQCLAAVRAGRADVESLFRETWMELLREIEQQQATILPKIHSHMALYRSELETIRKGRTTLDGYGVVSRKRGGIINSSS